MLNLGSKEEDLKERALKIANKKTKLKAEIITSSLGVNLLGVYDFLETIYNESENSFVFQSRLDPKGNGLISHSNHDLNAHHKKNIYVNVDIWYRVSDFLR